ncbi:MAG: hypothetical protein QME77_02530 [bacterium]|nr:hypothetical protein [bacterium]
MRRSLIALAVVAVLVMAASVPASAQSWFQFRFNPANANWKQTPPIWGDLPYTFNTTMLGGTAFIRPPGYGVGLRFNIDSGSLGSWSPLTSYDGGTWRYYDIGLGLPLALGRGSMLLFAGYGNHSWKASFGGTVISTQDAGGIVFGADLMLPLSGAWYATASTTFGSGLKYTYDNPPSTTPRAEGTASTSVYSLALGYQMPNRPFNVELGWRSGGFNVTAITSGDTGASNQDVRWSGWFLGLSTRR